MQETKSIKINQGEAKSIYDKLLSIGFKIEPVDNEYMQWRLVGIECIAILYKSGKLVLQGKAAESTHNILFKKSSTEKVQIDFEDHIGADEVGKGDYFGPLIVVSAFVSKDQLSDLYKLGVGDSKKITDTKILKIGEELIDILKYKCTVISPTEYNEKISKIGNISKYLAILHISTAKSLVKALRDADVECKYVIFDQFSINKNRLINQAKQDDLGIKLKQFHKGESDIAVACASIIARYYFLKEWEKMEKEYDFKFPKGASDVIEAGKRFISKHGVEKLSMVAKVSFKTTLKVTSPF